MRITFVLIISCLCTTFGVRINSVFRSPLGGYVMKTYDGYKRNISNGDILQSLDIEPSTVTDVITLKELDELKWGENIPLLTFPDEASPDDKIAMIVRKIILLQPAHKFVTRNVLIPRILKNPSVIHFNGKLLVCLEDRQIPGAKQHFGWMNESTFELYRKETNFGISYMTPLDRTDISQEDCHFLALADSPTSNMHEVLMTYSSNWGEKAGFHFFYVKISIPKHANSEVNATISASRELRLYPEKVYGMHQKSWVPFEYKDRVMFIPNLNPMHVVELLDDIHNKNSSSTEHGPGAAQIKTVYKATQAVELPWDKRYGELRGGTSAILIKPHNVGKSPGSKVSGNNREVYLAFFHTKTRIQMPHRIDTYFVGALTLCPKPPFQIHSMLPYPIIIEPWHYDGAWVFKTLDYGLYPGGLIYSSTNASEVIMSWGHQDVEGFMTVFDTHALLEAMTVVDRCD